MKAKHIVLAGFVAVIASAGLAADFDKGVAAYARNDYQAALKEFVPLAEQGDASAQRSLGSMYYYGNGVPQDYAEAARWYRKAAEQGVAFAQHTLGSMYYEGDRVLQDTIAAHMWFNISSANGSPEAKIDRKEVAKIMTPAAIEEALRRAKICMSSGYKNCD